MILHLDMDAFFASIEQLDNPRLKGKCVVVGKDSNRSVVAAASYEARSFGIYSAMPIFIAKKKCKDLIILPVRRNRYNEISIKIIHILESFSPLVEKVSIDEAYMDLSGLDKLFGNSIEIAKKIKTRIRDDIQLTCSIGIAPNKFLAKIASDLRKPDGLYIIEEKAVQSFIKTLPVWKVPGIGAKMALKLKEMGCSSLQSVQTYSLSQLMGHFGKYGEQLFYLSQGIDNSPVVKCVPPKSISTEETLEEDTLDCSLIHKKLLNQSFEISFCLRKKKVWAKSIGIKIKYHDYSQVIRSKTISHPTQSYKIISETVSCLFSKLDQIKKVRMIGISASGFNERNGASQLSLFNYENNDNNAKWDHLNEVMDSLYDKYGKNMIFPAELLNRK